MFTFKSIIIRSIEVYEVEQNTIRGIALFFNAYFQVLVYLELKHNKSFKVNEIQSVNKILKSYLNETDERNKNRLLIKIKHIVNNKYKTIHEFLELDEIKSSEYIPDLDYDIDRKYINGCVGTVIEE